MHTRNSQFTLGYGRRSGALDDGEAGALRDGDAGL